MLFDTIAAISTPLGEGGIAVIRVSGPDAIHVVESIVRTKEKLTRAVSHTVHYASIVRPGSTERLEEALVTIMRAPRSFTMEDVVEISCHGGIVAVKKVLDLLLEQQVRLAEPGEFTKRAFLNGRIDLSQAEAVMDLIRSKSDRAFHIAMKQTEGILSKRIQALRAQLVATMAHIEVNIDYPEHDVEELTHAYIVEQSNSAIHNIRELLRTADQGKLLREGITTVIVGKPNVGKSSLLNALAQDNRAIVTDIPGTTRDVIEEYVSLNGIPLRLLDTAGIRETTDVVERIGVERSRSALEQADLVLLVLNANSELEEEELRLLERMSNRSCILVLNKMDLPQRLSVASLERYIPAERIVRLSLVKQEGLVQLEKAISLLFFEGKLDSADITYVSNARHIQLLKKALLALDEAIIAVGDGIPIDMIQIDVRRAWEYLGEITGDTASDSLLDEIFSSFCLGK